MKLLSIVIFALYTSSLLASSIICHVSVCTKVSPGKACPNSIFFSEKSGKVQLNFLSGIPGVLSKLDELSLDIDKRKSLELRRQNALMLNATYEREHGMYVGELILEANEARDFSDLEAIVYCQQIN